MMGLGNVQRQEVLQLIEERCAPLEHQVRTLIHYNNLLMRKVDDLDQYIRRQNVVINGIAFKKNESPATIKSQVIAELRRLHLDDVIPYLDRAHRYGTAHRGEQSVIARFTSWDARNKLFSKRRDSTYRIDPDLTHRRWGLLDDARDLADATPLIKNVIVDRNCVLQAIAVDGSFHAFSSIEEFQLNVNAVQDKCQRIKLYYDFLRSPVSPWEEKCKGACSSCAKHHTALPHNGADSTRVISLENGASAAQKHDPTYPCYDHKNSAFVYVGRGEKYGNPGTVDKFMDHLKSSGLVKDVGELASKILVCHCAPGTPCHAHVLASHVNNM